MPKSNTPRAPEATPKGASPSVEGSSPKETTTQRVNGATLAESGSHAKKCTPTKVQAPATTTAPTAKLTRRTRAGKRTEVRLSGPYAKPAPSESDTDTPNPDLITGDEDSTAGSPALRATKPREGEPASARTTAPEPAPVEDASLPRPDVTRRNAEDFVNSNDSQDPKSSASATPPARIPPVRSTPPEDSPDPVDYEESEPDQDREHGVVPDPSSSPQLTEQQRMTRPGSPMTPKTAAAVPRVDAQDRRESTRDTAATVELKQQTIPNAGIDEGVPPEQLQSDNRRHHRERTQQETSQATGTKRERATSTPRTREQLLALRYWTIDEYREHLRLSRRPGPGVSQCDKRPVVLWDNTGLICQTNERECEA
ncbi:unnamed protein product [Phytophthora fragariaefolia]|uniref:Unnamed protein product n=1 Tax=Phytophthora fragariaefolia TaxID=1490495 RepID=A0A9W6U2T9_9STRA|nr:unnamed protein product [Phytophthora fragariaefolia]